MADSVLVNAEAVRRWLISEGYNPSNIEVIRNGIELDRFADKSTPVNLRKELGLDEDVPLIAMLARLNRLKGVDYFVEAAAQVAARHPKAHFLIVGDVRAVDLAYKEELRHTAERLGLGNRLVFTGFRTDVPQLLPEISISVLPSLSEGLSNALLESMAAGVPVIATSVGGNPEIVQHGQTGLLVPPADSKALADAILLLIENQKLARSYGEAGRQRIVDHFHLEKMIRSTEQHYFNLLARTDLKPTSAGEVAA